MSLCTAASYRPAVVIFTYLRVTMSSQVSAVTPAQPGASAGTQALGWGHPAQLSPAQPCPPCSPANGGAPAGPALHQETAPRGGGNCLVQVRHGRVWDCLAPALGTQQALPAAPTSRDTSWTRWALVPLTQAQGWLLLAPCSTVAALPARTRAPQGPRSLRGSELQSLLPVARALYVSAEKQAWRGHPVTRDEQSCAVPADPARMGQGAEGS